MNLWTELMARKQMIKAFKYSGLYLTVGSDERKIFPRIHSVKKEKSVTQYVFTLPNGLDPHILKKNFFAFHQVFGKNIELKGEYKTFEFNVYKASLPSELRYDYAAYSEHFASLKLPIVAGVDLNGKLIAYDMVTNPHLLIAGETGSGKSTQVRSVLSTLIQALPPDRLQLYLCDLKRSEFYLFRNVEHVQGLFVTPREMAPMLQKLRKEMQRRGDLLDRAEVSHVDELPEKLPYILLCIDEVALLQDEKEIMALIEEISAIGRALGCFLLCSLQRPDRKVLDGKLKNNLTVRMGFRCADLINSRIIGTPGSEKLKESGRFLLKLPAYTDLKEIQAPYLATDQAKKILETHKTAKPTDRIGQPLNASESIQETENDIFGVLG
jgi:DNA segregation ATPase FtsK/SpoIIIE, S-DNA-T family